VSLCSFFIPQI